MLSKSLSAYLLINVITFTNSNINVHIDEKIITILLKELVENFLFRSLLYYCVTAVVNMLIKCFVASVYATVVQQDRMKT